MKVVKYPNKNEWTSLLSRPVMESGNLEGKVSEMLHEVKLKGDKAVLSLRKKYEGYQGNDLIITSEEIKQSDRRISAELKRAIKTAYLNIHKFHSAQKEKPKLVTTMPGVKCWRESVAIEKVGLYIPGGSAPLFSTVLMLGVPAQIAACKEVVLCTPAGVDGKINAAILYAAKLIGATKLYKVGGVQAIAAMAYGTATIPKVDKIFGPGNQYVTCAKQLVNRYGVAIDMPAGPSEVAVLADDTAVPAFIASDLLSQAEHGADSQVLLVSNSLSLINQVLLETEMQLQLLPRKDLATEALKNSKAILVKDMKAGIELINAYAPEHLIMACKNEQTLAKQIVNAGSVFLGNYTPESAGDYASGTNHTLPTNGHARAYSGVSLDSFVKKITFQKITREGLQVIGKTIQTMAAAEQLNAHENAVSIRLKYKK